jgi:hypothetical protein
MILQHFYCMYSPYNHHHIQDTELFLHHKKALLVFPFVLMLTPPHFPKLSATTDLLSISVFCHFKMLCEWDHTLFNFSSQHNAHSIHPTCDCINSFLFIFNYTEGFHYENVLSFVSQITSEMTFDLFPVWVL